uniref:Uncharacterized protein n=1 Tax=Strombidium inclinatum TaxID=197538 RepID=A0A7S3MYA8_9SPIT|mmetsp:Transcript_28237/g.42735  ORF Transcript_28237/g.42735 Transcript_28237/m.42735 type:complete len:287 (+) Transcript_28237:3261-4121(+)
MKTERLFKEREEELKKMSDNLQFIESKNQLIQFNQLKKLFHCFVFKQHERQILCSSIMLHIMDEMRKDRKIKMILKDRGIEDYVNLDITDIDLDALEDLEEYDLPIQIAISEKLDFRKRLAQRASLTKLNYYAVMMRKVFGYANIPAPESFTDKLKNLQKNSAIAGVKRADSNKSFFSMVSRTNMSDKKSGEEDEEEYGDENDSGFEDDDDMIMSQDGQMKKKVNPLLASFGDLFGDLNAEIKDYSSKRYGHLVTVLGGEVKKEESDFDEFRQTMTSGQLVMTDFD